MAKIQTINLPPSAGQLVQQRRLEFRGVVHRKVAARVVDQPVGGTLAVGLLDQQAVGRHLEDVRIVRSLGRTAGLDLDRNQFSVVLHEVIRLARQPEGMIVQRLIDRAPGARIGVDDASAGQAGLPALPARLPQQKDRDDQGPKC